uniref:Uncharacterized LOC100181964 n=1 Tax=Ciona intestinalis TaxID=7719 RepID=F6RLB9_CIOIN|nr:uncharacterized protein LOC100181964 [Ciona intestinalis]|eukprot:XP_002129142.1 uncharacterized protein LOC100181964 [Ciona intestinalis]
MSKILLVLACLIVVLNAGRVFSDYKPLTSSPCTWSKARLRYKWKESPGKGCKICRCVMKNGSLWQDCKTYPRPTSWVENCRTERRNCKYSVVRADDPTTTCKVLAYTTYRYKIWVADRTNTK